MELKHLNAQEFETAIHSGKPAVIDFFATWCGPCKMLAPTMEALAEQYADKAVVAKVDVDQQRELAIRYGIDSVPTVLIVKDGKIAARKVGYLPMESYTEALDQLL